MAAGWLFFLPSLNGEQGESWCQLQPLSRGFLCRNPKASHLHCYAAIFPYSRLQYLKAWLGKLYSQQDEEPWFSSAPGAGDGVDYCWPGGGCKLGPSSECVSETVQWLLLALGWSIRPAQLAAEGRLALILNGCRRWGRLEPRPPWARPCTCSYIGELLAGHLFCDSLTLLGCARASLALSSSQPAGLAHQSGSAFRS